MEEAMMDMPFPPGILIEGSKCYFDGVDLGYLAHEFGTPLYVMSETIIRERCEELHSAFLSRYPGTRAYYASKALQTLDVLKIIKEEGLGVDVVSGGELYVALKAGIPPSDIIFHGNAKTDEELHYAICSGVGRIAVDNLEEIFRIEREASGLGKIQEVIFRIAPGVDSHTHRFISTGSLDSKFGIPLEPSEAERYVNALALCPHVEFLGLHPCWLAALGKRFTSGSAGNCVEFCKKAFEGIWTQGGGTQFWGRFWHSLSFL